MRSGGDAPRARPEADGLVALTLPSRPFTLADAIGASSAFSTPDRDLRGYPHATYWPPQGPNSAGTSEVFTDGGDIENYGLISLLRRGVKVVVVFINTMWPLSVDHDPSRWPRLGAIDPSLAPLFGAPGTRFPHNRVFPEADYTMVVAGLQEAKRRGDTVMTTTRLVVQGEPVVGARWRLGGHRLLVLQRARGALDTASVGAAQASCAGGAVRDA